MLNVTKKSMQILFIFIFIIITASCSLDERVDFSELIRRMNRQDDTYELLIEDAFFSDDEWFLFADTLADCDAMITGTEDENKLLTRVSVSVVNYEMQGQQEVFLKLCENIAAAFVRPDNLEAVMNGCHIYDDGVIFSDGAYFFEYGRYKTSLFGSDIGNTFVIEIIR